VTGIAGLSTVTGGLATPADNAGDATGTQIMETGHFRDQLCALLFEVGTVVDTISTREITDSVGPEKRLREVPELAGDRELLPLAAMFDSVLLNRAPRLGAFDACSL
jgi:hypothetical protein